MKTVKIIARIANQPEHIPLPNTGESFEFHGRRYTALGIEQGGLLAIAEEPIGRMPFDQDCNNDWAVSSIRKYLGGEYLAGLNKDELIPFMCEPEPEDGMSASQATEDYVFLLPLKLYRKYRNIIPLKEMSWWLASADPSLGNGVWSVYASGTVYDYNASSSNGVVPSLIINLQSFARR